MSKTADVLDATLKSEIPQFIVGYGAVHLYAEGVSPSCVVQRVGAVIHRGQSDKEKCLESIRAAILACGLKDGATISFHHHLRNGDDVLRAVMEEVAGLGLRNLRVAATSIFPAHAVLVDHIRSGVVDRIISSYIVGPVATSISRGELAKPAVLQSHGGRARAIETGDLHIDVAFIAAPAADISGNLSGSLGRAACGPLGYPMVDARYADRVVAITDTLSQRVLPAIDISQDLVDFVVEVDSIGDPARIVSGTTRVASDPLAEAIAETTVRIIETSGLLKDGFSFQAGAGGISLAVAEKLAASMRRRSIVGGFALGGVTSAIVEMFRGGLFRTLFDVQCFDLEAVESYRQDRGHIAISASLYASPASKGAMVDSLDVVVLGAAEVDLNFDVNVTAVNGGQIIGGSGGHADTASGAKLTIVTTRLTSGTNAKVVDLVECRTTPGATIDVVVTEVGVAVNPRREEIRRLLVAEGITVLDIGELRRLAAAKTGSSARHRPNRQEAPIVAVVEYRDGSVMDVIRQVEAP
ncbi:citrate lyase subunit alpha [Agrobacterium sp. MOPV5]|uniref:citrate lyase subunit alpha n=1 Tax=Agrobacterium leguminum TaxID=2792015 RepID=UPI0018C22DA1|nr:citrate lyase subunit alpha [Agrobacterium leguminum]MBG0512092.1 citrate lyase subunit alpha [Agrobacterium leguminum]